MSTHPPTTIDGIQPDIAILTSSAFTDARTKKEIEGDGVPIEEDFDDEKGSLDSTGKDDKKLDVKVEPVDEEGVRWAGGDEKLEAAGFVFISPSRVPFVESLLTSLRLDLFHRDDDDPEYANIPLIVRELCDFEDDPSVSPSKSIAQKIRGDQS